MSGTEEPEAPQPAPRPVQAAFLKLTVTWVTQLLLLSSLRLRAEWWWHFQLRFGTEQLVKEFCPEAV